MTSADALNLDMIYKAMSESPPILFSLARLKNKIIDIFEEKERLKKIEERNKKRIEELSNEIEEIKIQFSFTTINESPSNNQLTTINENLTLERLRHNTVESLESEVENLKKELEELKICLEAKDSQLEQLKQRDIILKNEIEELQIQKQSLTKENKDLECLFGYLQKQFKGLMRRMNNIDDLFTKQKLLISKVQEKHKDILANIHRYESFSQNIEEFFIEKDKTIKCYEEKLKNKELDINNLKLELATVNTKFEEEIKRNEELKLILEKTKEDYQKNILDLEKSLSSINKQSKLLKSKDERIEELENIISSYGNTHQQQKSLEDINEEKLKEIAMKEMMSAQLEEGKKKYENLLIEYENSKKLIDSLKQDISRIKLEDHGKLEFLQNEIKDLRNNRVELLNKIAQLESQLSLQKVTLEASTQITSKNTQFIDISDDIMDIENDFIINNKEDNNKNLFPEDNKSYIPKIKINCCKEPPYGLIIKCEKCKGQFHASCIDYEQYGKKMSKFICNRCKVTPIKIERNNKKRKKANILKIK